MKKIAIPLFFLLFIFYGASAQQIIHACCSDTICAPNTPIQLTATVDSGNTGAILNIEDDTYSQVVPMGFSFTYFGNTYTKCVLSTNNYITFDTTIALDYSPWPITEGIPSVNNPMNAIMGPWHDVDPSVILNPSLSYGTFGEAPNRVFAFNFCNVPMYECNDTLFTGQIILYETTNIIETHIGEKRECFSWNDGNAIHGLHNANGTVAVVVTGRNYPNNWTAFNEGTRFTPSGSTYTISTIPYAPVPFSAGSPQWRDEDGNFVNSGFLITVAPEETTTYFVSVSSCSNQEDSVTITVSSLEDSITHVNPHCPFSGDGSASITTTGNFSPNTFVWIDANGDTLQVTNNATTDIIQNLNGGTYLVIITNNIGCTLIDTVTLSVPSYSAGFSYQPSAICDGNPVSFTNLSTGAIDTYGWSFGDGTVSSVENPTHTYSGPGTYTVTQIVSAAGGCLDTFSLDLVVNPNIEVTFSISDPPYCVGNPITFTDESIGNPSSWQWSFGDGDSSNVQNPTHAYSNPDSFIIHVSIVDAFCGSGEFETTIGVNFVPDPHLREDTMLCPNEPLTLNADAAGTSYSWSTGETTEVISVLAPSEATYYIVVVDNFGCKGTDSVLITPDCLMLLPSAFTPNSDGMNDILHPLGSLLADYRMVVYSRWGEEIYSYSGNDLTVGWDGTYKGEPQEVGIYVYTLTGNFVSGESVTRYGNVTLVR